MAAKETPPPPPAPEAPPPKKGKKLLVIALGAVVLLVAIAATAFMLLKPPPAEHEEDDGAAPTKKTKKKDEKPAGPPAYLKLEAFTVNIQGEAGDQFLRLEVSAQFDEALEAERAKQYMPSIRNKVLLLLSGKKSSELGSKEAKEKLALEIRGEMNGILAQGGAETKGSAPVKDILFTEFVIQ